MTSQRALSLSLLSLVVGGTAILSGCKAVDRTLSNVAVNAIERRVTPELIRFDDVDMMCTFATGNAPLISGGVRALYGDPAFLEAVLFQTSSVCAENQAISEELRSIRAAREKRIEEAQDARISQKRLLERTARRQLIAFERMTGRIESEYRVKFGAKCPQFKNDYHELMYLLGTIAGLQAVVNDIAAEQAVGVSTEIAPKSERALRCLSNAKWWGAPTAARAVIWNILPGGSEGKDVWGTFQQSMIIGEMQGVRISHTLYALSALSIDDQPRFRDAVRRFANPIKSFKPNDEFRVVDSLSGAIMGNLSDRYWTENTGTRTPVGGLGKFWDDKPASSGAGVNLDDL
jgi:hypothetical protein